MKPRASGSSLITTNARHIALSSSTSSAFDDTAARPGIQSQRQCRVAGKGDDQGLRHPGAVPGRVQSVRQGHDHDEDGHRPLIRTLKKENKMDFSTSMAVAASGMRAQSERMKIIAENIANANSTSPAKGGDPYRRKIATISSNSTANWAPRWSRPASRWPTRATSAASTIPAIPMPTSPGLCEAAQCRQPGGNHGHARSAAFLRSRSTVMDVDQAMLAKTVDLLNK